MYIVNYMYIYVNNYILYVYNFIHMYICIITYIYVYNYAIYVYNHIYICVYIVLLHTYTYI